MPDPSVTTIEGLGRRAAAYRALHHVLFEALGRWATAEADHTSPSARPFYAAWSQHQAWHAELWAARHPTAPDADLDAATASARARLDPVATALAALPDDTARLTFLADQVLPQLEQVLAEHRERLDERLDAPTARVVDLVLTDVRRDRESAERLVPDPSPDVPAIDLVAPLT